MDHTSIKLKFQKATLPNFWRYGGSIPGGNEDDLKKFQKISQWKFCYGN